MIPNFGPFMAVTPQKGCFQTLLYMCENNQWEGQNNCDVASKQLCSASQNSCVCWQSNLLTCPSNISPGKLQGGEKEMNKHTSLSSNRKQILAECAISKGKKSLPIEVCTCKCFARPIHPPPIQHCRELEELVIDSVHHSHACNIASNWNYQR